MRDISKVKTGYPSRPQLKFADPKDGRLRASSPKAIAKRSASSAKFLKMLTTLIESEGYKTYLETGTSVGVSLRCALLTGIERLTTIEGSPELASYAQSVLPDGDRRSSIVVGNVLDVFESTLTATKPDVIFLDADHRSSTVLSHLETIKKKHPNVQCVILHDIYWSKDMKEAWNKIIDDPAFHLTIDIFEAGLIFPNYPMEKQHFRLRF